MGAMPCISTHIFGAMIYQRILCKLARPSTLRLRRKYLNPILVEWSGLNAKVADIDVFETYVTALIVSTHNLVSKCWLGPLESDGLE